MSIKRFCVLVSCALMLSGCISAHKYSAIGINHFHNSKFIGKSFVVGEIKLVGGKDGKVNNPDVRLGTMSSPYDNSYAEYLKRALIMELVEVEKYSDTGNFVISGTLLKNEITSPVFEQGKVMMSARIVVKDSDSVLFDKVVEYENVWDVPFAGDDARRKAPHIYLKAMNKFVELIFDQIDFGV